jgi:3-hydroxyisobutyrate dehydrogenase-like beta-hydroxyacid dehydrogenase
MAAGQRFGLDPGVMIDVLNRSSGQSRSTSSKWPAAEPLPPTADQTELAAGCLA